ncbi:MAG: hypothetical protein IAF02_25645 [Anaerolineae bacterium]|nr:hypothetical protein [Anaerolineae bacterium]
MPTDWASMLRAGREQVTTQPQGIDWASMLRQPAAQAGPAPVSSIEQAAQQVTDEMGTGERLLVGTGRGMMKAWRGIEQLGLQAGSALGINGAQASLDALQAQEEDERQIFDAGVGKTTAGTVGAFAGETIPFFAVPGGALARGASLAKTVAAGARVGGLAGGLQYVDDGESRISNALTGAAMGGLAGGVIRTAAQGGAKLANAVQGRLAPAAEEVATLGRQFDVPVFAPDMARSPLMSKVATLSEDIPFVGMGKPRMQQAEAAGRAASDLVGRLAPEVDDVGRAIQGSLARKTETLQKMAARRYDRVAKAADPQGAVPLANLRSTAKQLLDDAKQDIDPNNALIARLEKIANAPDGPNFSKVRQFRSNIGDSIRQLESSMDLKAARPLQQLRGALEKDMNQFASNAGGEVSARWKSADRFFREQVIPQRESDIVKAMRNRNPDEIFRQFVKSGTQDRSQRLYNALDRKGRDAVKSGILNQAMERATTSGANGVAFSPARFAGELDKVQGSLGVFMKGTDKKELDGFVKLMQHVQRAGQVAENPPTGNRLVLPVLMGEALAPGTSAAALSSGALSRMLFTTEAGKRLLLASNRYPIGSPKMQRMIQFFREQAPALVGAQADDVAKL